MCLLIITAANSPNAGVSSGGEATSTSTASQDDQQASQATSSVSAESPQDVNVAAAMMKPPAPSTPSPNTQRRAWAAGA